MVSNKRVLAAGIGVIAVAIIAAMVLLNTALAGYATADSTPPEPGEFDGLAKCLSENGFKMAGAEWCSACKKQKQLFGASFQFVDYKDCGKEGDYCIGNEVQYYPTWILPAGEKLVGVQSLEKLASLSGCEI